jgi:hypothetical protein
MAEAWEHVPRFGQAITDDMWREARQHPSFLQHGWVRFRAWGSAKDYASALPSIPIALQVLHVAMVYTVEEHPPLTCLMLRDGRWYVAMAFEDVLRVMEVLT